MTCNEAAWLWKIKIASKFKIQIARNIPTPLSRNSKPKWKDFRTESNVSTFQFEILHVDQWLTCTLNLLWLEWIITATISRAFCSFAYLLHRSLLEIKFTWCLKIKLMCEWKTATLHGKYVIMKTRTIVNKAEHTDTFLMSGKPSYCRECYRKGRFKIISIYNPTVLAVSHFSHSNEVSKFSHFPLTK